MPRPRGSIEFVKGHCGWDTVTLIAEGEVDPEHELQAALMILDAPISGGLEVGVMGHGARPGEITLRMVSATARDWISMCGGMTQVIGKALVETFLRERFAIDCASDVLNVRLLTPSGDVPIVVDVCRGEAKSVKTFMNGYLDYTYRLGIEARKLRGISVLRVGEYAVIDIVDLERARSDLDFTRRDFGPPLEFVNTILREFGDVIGARGVTGMLFDDRPEGSAHFRVFPRFYSEDMVAARTPWEFQCGTGSIAVAVALAYRGRLPFTGGTGTVQFEWGSQRTTPDPYGVRTSLLEMAVAGTRVTECAFSHSVVEILAEGRLTLPHFR